MLTYWELFLGICTMIGALFLCMFAVGIVIGVYHDIRRKWRGYSDTL